MEMSRRQIFRQRLLIPEPFLADLGDLPSDQNLRRVSGCLPYLYLVDFVVRLSQSWWQLPAAELNVLDWGCGTGPTSYLLTRHGVRPTCADRLEHQAQRHLLEAAGLPLVPLQHDWQLPFGDQSFHVVLSFGVLEHVPDDAASLREIHRVLRPGGLFLCFNLPRKWSWIMQLVYQFGNHYHDRLYTSQSVHRLLTQANLKLMESWRRQLFPKNRVPYPFPYQVEWLDQWLCDHTPLGYLATSLEFVAYRE
jgi:2-polyprenyl-3-methyl-5-hydroxy-6-metoxy-1,4-benzoquinol methylase